MTKTIPIARAIVYHDGKILVLQNSADDPNKNARNKWEMPGGTVESHDEHERAAVIREVYEETGIDVVVEEKLSRLAVTENDVTADCQYFLVRATSRKVTLSEEHQDYRWIKPGEFKDMNWLNYAGYTIPLLEKLGERISSSNHDA